MTITSPMLFPSDVIVISSHELDETTRSKCGCAEGSFVLTRPHSRTPSTVVNQAVVDLLNQFRKPTTIVEAALRIAVEQGQSPETVLEKVFFALQPFIKGRWLVPSGAPDAGAIEISLTAGEQFGEYTVTSCVQVLEDTEVYQLKGQDGQIFALKIARDQAFHDVTGTFENEQDILQVLGGWPAPRLLDFGLFGSRNYLVMEWCSGAWATNTAAEIRGLSSTGTKSELVRLCCEVTRAYAQIHNRGILHGDIYPKNVLVGRRGSVRLIDFGLARRVGDGTVQDRLRRGVPEFYEPELAAALLAGRPRLPSTLAGEQYALGALLYLLVCGARYLDFAAYKDDLLLQITEQDPLPFAAHGVPAWPELEAVLSKALSKDPSSRFSSVTELHSALVEIESACSPAQNPLPISLPPVVASDPIIAEHEFSVEAELPRDIPHSSFSFGAAGIAYSLLCVSSMRCDARLLATADAWSLRAEQTAEEKNAFTSDALDIREDNIGAGSLWFGAPGVYLVKALISQALGDQQSVAHAVSKYRQACGRGCNGHDLTIGTAGQLLGCALLVDAITAGGADASGNSASSVTEVKELGRSLQTALWTHLESSTKANQPYLGVAHGIAGQLYALLLWSEITGQPLPSGIKARLEGLAGFAQYSGRGVRFPVRGGQSGAFMESWCHGTPGYVHLWAAAFRLLRDPKYLQLVDQCAWTAWETAGFAGSLCCGDAGRSYALVSAWRHTGDQGWLLKATELSRRAVQLSQADNQLRLALYKGLLGAYVLVEDLETVMQAGMPLFERDRRGGHLA